jgi:hypothetical protein
VVLATTFKLTSILRRCHGALTMHAISHNVAVSQQCAMFSELLAWLDQPYTADVPARRHSKFHVGGTLGQLTQEPVASPYSVNRTQVELTRQVQDGRRSSIVRKTIDKIEESLGASGGNLVYAGYPYDPL